MARADGGFIIPNLLPGAYTLQVTNIGYQPLTQTVTLTATINHLKFFLTPSTTQLQGVEVAGWRQAQAQKAQSVTTVSVSRAQLEKQSSNTFVNGLQKIPGVNAINTGVGIAKPVIRGMSFNRVIVNDRGIKQEGQQWGADHGLEIDQFDPDRVEIVKGPAALLYGSDGLGGVVNILPPILPAKNTIKGSFLSTYKSNNHLFGTSTMIEGNQNDWVFRGRFSTQDFADYRVPADEFTYNRFILPLYNQELKNTAGRERNASAMVGVRRPWGSATLSISNFSQRAGLFAGALGIPREYQLTSDGDTRDIDTPSQKTDHFKAIANINWLFGDGWLEADIGYQKNYRREISQPHAHGKGPRPEGTDALILTLQTYTANFRYHTTPHHRLKSTYGLQAQYQQNVRGGFEHLLSNFTAGGFGVYTQQTYTLNPSLTTNAGIRFDIANRDIERYAAPIYEDEQSIIGYDERNAAINRTFSNLSGAFGLSYHSEKPWQAKLNFGSSFRVPTAPELSANGIHHGTFRHEVGDSTLNTERGWQADIHWSYVWNKLTLNITPFYNYFNNYIYLGPTSRFSNLPEGGQVYRYQQNNAIFTGAEASVEYELVNHIHIQSGYEYVWARNIDTGLGLPFTPPMSVFGELSYEKTWQERTLETLYFTLFVQRFASQNHVDRNELATPGYTLTNFTAGTRVKIGRQPIHINFVIQNLFDTRYLNHLSRYRLLNLPEQGRNFNVLVKVPFTVKANQ